jgi:hypothetical protein
MVQIQGGRGVKREVQKGWWCRKCERNLDLGVKTCRCMNLIPEHRCEAFRLQWWLASRVTLEVTMASANRRPRVMLSDSKGPA